MILYMVERSILQYLIRELTLIFSLECIKFFKKSENSVINKDKIEINNKRYIKQGGWECTYYIFFFFDLGLIGAAMLVLIVLGITTIGALGEWIAENYVIVMAIILLVSVIKTLILGKEAKHGPGN